MKRVDTFFFLILLFCSLCALSYGSSGAWKLTRGFSKTQSHVASHLKRAHGNARRLGFLRGTPNCEAEQDGTCNSGSDPCTFPYQCCNGAEEASGDGQCFLSQENIPFGCECSVEESTGTSSVDSECYHKCAQDEAFIAPTSCIPSSSSDTSGTCGYLIPDGCSCADGRACLNECIDGTCDFYRMAGEGCARNEHCASGNCVSDLCVGIANGQSCTVPVGSNPRTLNPCESGFFCDFSNGTDASEVMADTPPLGVCRSLKLANDPCTIGDFLNTAACGPGSFCDIPLYLGLESSQFEDACFNNSRSTLLNCGSCRDFYSSSTGPCGVGSFVCEPGGLACDGNCRSATNYDCSETSQSCSLATECQCNGADFRCQEDNPLFASQDTLLNCKSEIAAVASNCPQSNNCMSQGVPDLSILNDNTTCMGQNCRAEIIDLYCCILVEDTSLVTPCGLDCSARTYNAPSPCCTNAECHFDTSSTEFDPCSCYDESNCPFPSSCSLEEDSFGAPLKTMWM